MHSDLTIPMPSKLAHKATRFDLDRCLVLLDTLPAKPTENAALAKESYWIAIEGCSLHGLETAVRQILRGGLKHRFFPSAVELKMQVDVAERPLWDAHRLELSKKQKPMLIGPTEPITPETRANVAEMLKKFHTELAKASLAMKLNGPEKYKPNDGLEPPASSKKLSPFEIANRKFDAQRGVSAPSQPETKISPEDPRLDGVKDALHARGFKQLRSNAI